MGHLLDQTNKYDIGHCEGEIRQKSKLLKILLLKGKRECMELFKVVGENLKREDLLQTMKERIDYIETRGNYIFFNLFFFKPSALDSDYTFNSTKIEI